MRTIKVRRLARRLLAPAARRLLGTITHVTTEEPVVALTFDDGPNPDVTPHLLALLDRYGARATFFMVGEAARQHADLVRQVADRGHAIGNHSWDHPPFTFLSGRQRRRQISACQVVLAPYAARLFRHPYGLQTLWSRLDAFRLGFEVVQWDTSPGDWYEEDPDAIASRIVANIRPGSIVLLHDALYDRGQPGFALPLDRVPHVERAFMLRAVDVLLARTSLQYRFVTIPALLRLGRPERRILWHRGHEQTPTNPSHSVGELS